MKICLNIVIITFLLYMPGMMRLHGQVCSFNNQKMSYNGTPQEQAKCLLREVKYVGEVADQPLSDLPEPLNLLIGAPVQIKLEDLRNYINSQNLVEDDHLCGSLDDPLSATKNNTRARYFVIHDTATKTGKTGTSFSDQEMGFYNSNKWSRNDLSTINAKDYAVHAFVSRMGDSRTIRDYKEAASGVKFSSYPSSKIRKAYKNTYTTDSEVDRQLNLAKKRWGLFLNIELRMPRKIPAKGKYAAVAPSPGFTKAQYDRLALLYVCAAFRKGEWLIPAFHCVIDHHLGGHDDPQNFDLNEWCNSLSTLLDTLGCTPNILQQIYEHDQSLAADQLEIPFSFNYNLQYEVELVGVDDGIPAWAAAAAMIVSWRDGVSINPQEIVDGLGYWQNYQMPGSGKSFNRRPHFYDTWALTKVEVPALRLFELRQLLAHGPLLISTDELGANAQVIIGMSGEGHLNDTLLIINDPTGPGATKEISFPDFKSKIRKAANSGNKTGSPAVLPTFYIHYPGPEQPFQN